jgi:hypothetical protein
MAYWSSCAGGFRSTMSWPRSCRGIQAACQQAYFAILQQGSRLVPALEACRSLHPKPLGGMQQSCRPASPKTNGAVVNWREANAEILWCLQ